MIIKIKTNQKTITWNSTKCIPLQVFKNMIILSIPFLAAMLGGMMEVML